jgi:hypothetical protein
LLPLTFVSSDTVDKASAAPLAVLDNLAPAPEIRVDVELVLAVDVSMSMMVQELRIQRDGYVAAMQDARVHQAMFSGPNRRVAIAYVEWSGVKEQRIVVPWTILSGPADANEFARQLRDAPTFRFFRTSVSGAMEFAATLFDGNGIAGEARVIDISGDGANNDGLPVTVVRDAAVANGIVINGLPLMTNIGLVNNFDVKELDTYYADCVVGGPGSFSLPVRSWEEFGDAVRRKLIREVSRREAPPDDLQKELVGLPAGLVYDCLAGEKLWNLQQGQ